jgi:uncharacterized membrane protein
MSTADHASDGLAPPDPPPRKSRTVRFLLKGLAVVLPTILTIVIVIWLAGLLHEYVIQPSTFAVRYSLALFLDESRPKDDPALVVWERLPALKYCGTDYFVTRELRTDLEARVANALAEGNEPLGTRTSVPVEWVRERSKEVFVPMRHDAVPYDDFARAAARLDADEYPRTANGVYREIVTDRYFYGMIHLTAVMVVATIVLLYFLGGLFTARLGAWFVHKFEHNFLGRLPIISNVYSSVKQVTDFFFTERTVEYNSIVAVEYPRRGIWSIGFVTSEGFLEVTAAIGEPMVAVLMPTSPMPMTGFTITVPRSQVVDLDITVDQAFQFCLSCGVLVPPQQQVTPEKLREEFARRFTGKFGGTDAIGRTPGSPAAVAESNRTAEWPASDVPSPPLGPRPDDHQPGEPRPEEAP